MQVLTVSLMWATILRMRRCRSLTCLPDDISGKLRERFRLRVVGSAWPLGTEDVNVARSTQLESRRSQLMRTKLWQSSRERRQMFVDFVFATCFVH